MRKARLLKVLPAQKRVVTIASTISLRDMRRLCGTSDMLATDYGTFDDYLLRALKPRRDLLAERALPRFRIGEYAAIAGDTILFGANRTGAAAECPLTAAQVLELIEYLPSLADLDADRAKLWSAEEAIEIAEELDAEA